MQLPAQALLLVAEEGFHCLSRWASISRYLHFQPLQLLPSWHGGTVLTFSVHLSRREVGAPVSVSPLFLLHNHIALSSRIRRLKSICNNLCKVARKPCCRLHFTSNKLKACLWFFFNHSAAAAQSEHVKQLHRAHQLSHCFLPQTPHSRSRRNQ